MNGLEKQREYRLRTDNVSTKKYEKTKSGFLMRLYRNMQSRTCGVQKMKYHLYKGCCLLPRDEFYKWANESKMFNELFKKWKSSEYDRKLTPSVDRVDSDFGYSVDNMEWVTHSENSRRGSKSTKRHHKYSKNECIDINNMRLHGGTYKDIAEKYKTNPCMMYQIINSTEYFKEALM